MNFDPNSMTPLWVDPTVLSPSQYAYLGISLALSILLPIVLFIFLGKKGGYKAALVGLLCFFIMQILLRSTVLSLLPLAFPALQKIKPGSGAYYMYMLLVGGLSAGLVEEWGRYLFMRWLLKGEKTPQRALAFGAGHGGIEAVLVVGVSVLVSVLLVPQQFATTHGPILMLGGVERVFAMLFHLAMSVLVMMHGLTKTRYVWLAVLLHTLLNFVSVGVLMQVSIWATEAFIAAAGIASLLYILWEVRRFNEAQTEIPVLDGAQTEA